MAYQIPQFTMGQTAIDFSPLQNALGQVAKTRMANAKLEQDRLEFEARNKIAQQQLGFQQQAADRASSEFDRTEATRKSVEDYLAAGNFSDLPPELVGVARAQRSVEPIRDYILAKAKKKAESSGPEGYGKSGAIFQNPDGTFSAVQFGERGNLKTHPLGSGVAPARGVTTVGDEIVSNATGAPVRNVGPQIQAEAVNKGVGQATAKTIAELPEAKQRMNLVLGSLSRLKQGAQSLAAQPGLGRVAGGLYQAYAPNVSEEALNAGSDLENLKVKISGTVMQAMRDASKTGGAVGQVTEREWPRLENMIANLDPKQGLPQFKRNLAQVEAYAAEVEAALKEAYEADLAVARGGRALVDRAAGQPPLPPVNGGFKILRRVE